MTTTAVNEAIGFTLKGIAFDTLFNVGKIDRTSTMFNLTLSDGSVFELDGTDFKRDSIDEFVAGKHKELKFFYDGATSAFDTINGFSHSRGDKIDLSDIDATKDEIGKVCGEP